MACEQASSWPQRPHSPVPEGPQGEAANLGASTLQKSFLWAASISSSPAQNTCHYSVGLRPGLVVPRPMRTVHCYAKQQACRGTCAEDWVRGDHMDLDSHVCPGLCVGSPQPNEPHSYNQGERRGPQRPHL